MIEILELLNFSINIAISDSFIDILNYTSRNQDKNWMVTSVG